MNSPNPPPSPPDSTTISDQTFQTIREAFNGLRFGQVIVTVQDGKVMQIDRTERRRLVSDSPAAK